MRSAETLWISLRRELQTDRRGSDARVRRIPRIPISLRHLPRGTWLLEANERKLLPGPDGSLTSRCFYAAIRQTTVNHLAKEKRNVVAMLVPGRGVKDHVGLSDLTNTPIILGHCCCPRRCCWLHPSSWGGTNRLGEAALHTAGYFSLCRAKKILRCTGKPFRSLLSIEILMAWVFAI